MKIIDQYVSAVGKNLPRKNRSDIEAELRSNLEDMLEDRSRQTGQPVDEALAIDLLREHGSPEKIASAYTRTRYLIGPNLYPIFELVVKVVISVIFAIALIAFGVGYTSNPSGPNFIQQLISFFFQVVSGLVTAFGNIVIVFAILERLMPSSELEKEVEEEATWDPKSLEKEPDPDQVKPSELIIEILFMVAALVIFNLYPNIVGIGFVTDGKWFFAPALSEAFFTYLPWINILAFLQIMLNLVLMRQGVWQVATRLFHITLEIAGVILAFFMVTGPSLINLSGEALANTSIGEAWPVMERIFNILPQFVLIILIVVQSIEVGKTVYSLLRRK
jgi:hypothetical protein